MTRTELMQRFGSDPVFYQWTRVIESAVVGGSLTIDDFFDCVRVAKELIACEDAIDRASQATPSKEEILWSRVDYSRRPPKGTNHLKPIVDHIKKEGFDPNKPMALTYEHIMEAEAAKRKGLGETNEE